SRAAPMTPRSGAATAGERERRRCGSRCLRTEPTPYATDDVVVGRSWARVRPMTHPRVRGGFNQYGFTVGVLILDTQFPRVVGDIGNAQTFPFPIRYHRVTGAAPDLVVRRGAEGLLPAFVEGARELEREGVGA